MEKKFEEMTVVELKALAFDLYIKYQQVQQDINIVQNRIKELTENNEK